MSCRLVFHLHYSWVTMSKESVGIKNDSDKGFGKAATAFAAGLVACAILAGAAWFLISKRRADCFLRVGIDLGLERSVAGHGEKEAAALPTARVRDVILQVLSTYHSADLLAPEGKLKLKQELVKSLQAAAPELGVREVYITDFLVQR